MRARILCICVLFNALASLAYGQQLNQNPLEQGFFPPDLVMRHQEELGLNEEQRTSIRAGLRDAQEKFIDWQWKLENELESMASLIRQSRVDEQQALAQLEKVLTVEREIKRTQIALLVHIKNKLTPEQQAKLQELRRKTGAR
jgi:Spy/CpxP family protein refolding chaperone